MQFWSIDQDDTFFRIVLAAWGFSHIRSKWLSNGARWKFTHATRSVKITWRFVYFLHFGTAIAVKCKHKNVEIPLPFVLKLQRQNLKIMSKTVSNFDRADSGPHPVCAKCFVGYSLRSAARLVFTKCFVGYSLRGITAPNALKTILWEAGARKSPFL